VVRRGDTGVPEGKTGKRMRGRDSDLLYCLDCKSSWRSSQGTLSENLGYDRHGVNLT
jgi:hypothetical protein